MRVVGYAAGPAVLVNGHVAEDGLGYQVALGFEFFEKVFRPHFQFDIHGRVADFDDAPVHTNRITDLDRSDDISLFTFDDNIFNL